MKNKNLFILLLSIFILAGLVFVLLTLKPAEENNGTTSSPGSASQTDKSESMIYSSQSPVSRIHISRPQHVYSIETSDGGKTFSISGLENMPLNQSLLDSTVTNARQLPASLLLETNGETDLEQFGLGETATLVSVSFQDGLKMDLSVGNIAPGDEDVYVLATVNETRGVYLAPLELVEGYLLDNLDYLNMSITEATGAGQTYDRVTLSGSSRETPIVVEAAPSLGDKSPPSYRITAPIVRDLRPNGGDVAIQSLFSLTADSVEALRPDADTLASHGLGLPYSTAAVTGSAQGGFTLLASAPDADGNVFVLREGVPILYKVSAAKVPWLEADYYEMASPNPISVPVETLEELVLETPDAVHSFVLAGPAGENGEYTVTMDGKAIDYQVFSSVLSAALDANLYWHSDEPAIAPPPVALRITYRYNTGAPEDVITVYQVQARQVFVQRGDEPIEFLASSTYLDRLLQQLTEAAQSIS